MKTVSVSDARGHLSQLVHDVAYDKGFVVLTNHGRKLAALVPAEDLDYFQKLEDQIDAEEAKKALADAKKHGTIPFEKVFPRKKR
jgi:prevent-host-death family protein